MFLKDTNRTRVRRKTQRNPHGLESWNLKIIGMWLCESSLKFQSVQKFSMCPNSPKYASNLLSPLCACACIYVCYIRHPHLLLPLNSNWNILNQSWIQLWMATTRLLHTSRPIQLPSSSSSTSSFIRCVRYKSRASLNGDHNISSGKGERKPVMAVKASVATTHVTTSQPVVRQGLLDLAAFITSIRNAMLVLLRTSVKRKLRNLQPQMLIERVLIITLLP